MALQGLRDYMQGPAVCLLSLRQLALSKPRKDKSTCASLGPALGPTPVFPLCVQGSWRGTPVAVKRMEEADENPAMLASLENEGYIMWVQAQSLNGNMRGFTDRRGFPACPRG